MIDYWSGWIKTKQTDSIEKRTFDCLIVVPSKLFALLEYKSWKKQWKQWSRYNKPRHQWSRLCRCPHRIIKRRLYIHISQNQINAMRLISNRVPRDGGPCECVSIRACTARYYAHSNIASMFQCKSKTQHTSQNNRFTRIPIGGGRWATRCRCNGTTYMPLVNHVVA